MAKLKPTHILQWIGWKPVYLPIHKCSSFFTWLYFHRVACGTWYPRICGWDFYGCWQVVRVR